jgi:O-antigen/teichoic acid export membrane protein
MFGIQWLYNSNVYYLARDGSLIPKQVGNNLALSCVFSLIACVAYVVLYEATGGLGSANVDILLIILMLTGIPFQFVSTAMIGTLLGMKRYVAYNIMTLVQSSLLTFSLFVLLVFLGGGLREAMLMYVAVNIFQAVAITALLRYYAGNRIIVDLSSGNVREELIYGTKMVVNGLASLVVIRGGVLIINAFQGEYDTGQYAIALRFMDLVFVLPNIVNAVLFPAVTAMTDPAERHRVLLRWSVIVFLVEFVGVVILAIWSNFFIGILFGNEFLGSAGPLLWLLPGALALSVEMVIIVGLSAAGLPRSVPMLWMVIAAASVGGNVLVQRFGGAVGTAAVTSVCFMLVMLGIGFLYLRHYRVSLLDVLMSMGGEVRRFLRRA